MSLCRVLTDGYFGSEVHELHTKIHDILDNSMSKLVGNTAHMLAFLFNSASRQCHDAWTLQFPFLHSTKDTVPPSEILPLLSYQLGSGLELATVGT